MENKKINLMGSEVVSGYQCKPVKLDPNKPIMHYKAIIYICHDERCAKAGSKERANELREILKELNLHKGKNRIKISRSFCQGACRFRQVAQINDRFNLEYNSIWLKHTQKLKKEDWIEIFKLISQNKPLKKYKKFFIPMKVYE